MWESVSLTVFVDAELVCVILASMLFTLFLLCRSCRFMSTDQVSSFIPEDVYVHFCV